MSDLQRSDLGQDDNTSSQVVILKHEEKEIVSKNLQDTLVALISGMQGGDFFEVISLIVYSKFPY